jgi:tetratricopeptide (TPR) repeat protein
VLGHGALWPVRRGIAALAYVVHHPGRVLAVALLVALIAAGAALAGTHLWARYHFQAAQLAAQRTHNTEALEHLETYLRLRPRDPDALLLAARVARRLEAFDHAALFLQRYQAERGENDDLLLERVLLRAESGEMDQVALFGHTLVQQEHPASSLILEAFVHGYLRMYRLREADVCLNLWLERDPDNPRAHFFQGLRFEQAGGSQEALTSYRRVVQLDPEQDEARQHMASILVQLRLSEEALPHLEYLVSRQPDNALIQVELARCRGQLGQQAAAEEILDQVLARQPDFPPAVTERGKLAYQAGHLEEAEEWLRRASALQPGDYQTHYLYSQCLVRSGKNELAKEVVARMKQIEEDVRRIDQIVNGLMQKKPHDPALHYEAGMIAIRAGALADGLRWLNSALKEDPNYVPAHQALAYYYQRTGDTARASHHRELAQQAESKKP